MMKRLIFGLLGVAAVLLSSCSDSDVESGNGELGFDEFYPRYNAYVKKWVAGEVERVEEAIAKEKEALAGATDEAVKQRMTAQLAELDRELKKYQFRQEVGDYYSIKTPADVPEGLVWKNGDTVPAVGDPRAKKGGVFNQSILSFPATVRRFDKNSNNSFRGEIYDNIEMGLVGQHSITKQFYGVLATEWAISEDGRTVYYKLRKEATYSDGVPVTSKDYLVFSYLRLSDNVTEPYYKIYLREQFANFTTYGDHMLSVTLPEQKPMMPFYAAVTPAPSHFYKDYGPDYVQRYQWKVEPTTGAYTVKDGDIEKGRSITLSRVKDWWGNDIPQLKNAYNVDSIVYRLIQDESKAFELFRIGQLDWFGVTRPEFWYDKTEIEPVFKGYIEKATFYNNYPVVPRGFFFNVTKAPVDNLEVRKGFAYAMNVKKMINAMFRGDYDRLESFSMGFGDFTNEEVKARRYSITKAREHFANAGYTEVGEDGILRKPDGTRLEIEVTFQAVAYYPKMMAIFKEEAKKAGMDMVLDGQEATLAFKKSMDKLHTVTFSGWGVTPPFPRYHQFFHSINAVDENGKPKPQTNNLNVYADPKMDILTTTVRNARTLDEMRDASLEVQQIIHDEVLFVPTFYTPFVRVAYWRWVKWPDTPVTRFADPITYIPVEAYTYWIDEDVKKETIQAKREGKSLGEKVHVFDHYRNGVPEEDKKLRRKP